jgi:hypothetical protein
MVPVLAPRMTPMSWLLLPWEIQKKNFGFARCQFLGSACFLHAALIAEDVAKVNPALIAVDKEGKPYTVRYNKINAMLLNEFLKEHRKVQEQEATIAHLKEELQT